MLSIVGTFHLHYYADEYCQQRHESPFVDISEMDIWWWSDIVGWYRILCVRRIHPEVLWFFFSCEHEHIALTGGAFAHDLGSEKGVVRILHRLEIYRYEWIGDLFLYVRDIYS